MITNLLIFGAGFITFKLYRVISISLPLYLMRRKLRNKWVGNSSKHNVLIYNRKFVK
jgi:hypothetical protein